MILDAPGAVLTTSTRADNLAITLAARVKAGPAMVFDPQHLAGSLQGLPSLRWSLSRGCEDAQTAMIRANTLVVEAKKSGVENASFWRIQALVVTQCLLHAAALEGRPARDLYRWSHSAAASKDAVRVLTDHPGAIPDWDRALDAICSSDQRTRDSVWGMVANSFAPLADPALKAALTPNEGFEFDPLAFLAMRGTVYLMGTYSVASNTSPVVAAFIEDLIDAGRRLAARCPGQRLDPPLALILDEAANYPLPSLPSLMSEGGGSGITTVAVLQSLAQARNEWGPDSGSGHMGRGHRQGRPGRIERRRRLGRFVPPRRRATDPGVVRDSARPIQGPLDVVVHPLEADPRALRAAPAALRGGSAPLARRASDRDGPETVDQTARRQDSYRGP